MISKVAIGAAEVPEAEPAVPVVVVVPLSNSMSTATSYVVELLLPVELPSADVAVTDQTATDVELTFTRPDGYAGSGLTVYLLCTESLNYDVDGPGDISADLRPGWTGTTALYKEGASVYLQFDLTATATIDGTPKADFTTVLDFPDAMFAPQWGVNAPVGVAFDETNQLFVMRPDSTSLYVEGSAGVTGNWVDGVSGLRGQVSWLAESPQPA